MKNINFEKILDKIKSGPCMVGYKLSNLEEIETTLLPAKDTQGQIVTFSSKSDDENISYLKDNSINHLFGKSDNIENEYNSVVDTISSKSFKIENFLQNGKVLKSISINHSKDITQEIETLLEVLDYTNIFESPRANLRIVLNELLTNAFFHQEDLLDKDRKNSVFTNFSTPITASIAQDDKSILIYVKDNVGTITRSNIISSIHRAKTLKAPREDGPGAGLGMAMIFENLNQLHVNKASNVACEFIGIIDTNKRYKKFKERVTSFHFYGEK